MVGISHSLTVNTQVCGLGARAEQIFSTHSMNE